MLMGGGGQVFEIAPTWSPSVYQFLRYGRNTRHSEPENLRGASEMAAYRTCAGVTPMAAWSNVYEESQACMAYFILFYDVVDDFPAKRTPFRAQHLQKVQEAHDRGELLMAGALAEPADRAVLVFRVADRSAVEDFARGDPYVTNGLVTGWQVRAWTQVIATQPGEDALVKHS